MSFMGFDQAPFDQAPDSSDSQASGASSNLRQRWNISRWALAYPRWTIGLWLAIAAAGLVSFGSLKYALFPDVTFPVVIVNATAPFTTALQTETDLVNPLEQRLQSLVNVEGQRSAIYPGRTAISLAFRVGGDLGQAEAEVKTLLRDAPLPKGATLDIQPFNLNESAAISYALRGQRTPEQLQTIVETEITPNLTKIPGVLRVDVLGNPTASSKTPSLVRFNGESAIALRLIKTAEANTLEIVNQATLAVKKLEPRLAQLPGGLSLSLAATQADFINEATQATIDDLILALGLAAIIVYPFLRSWQATLIAALAIPTSILGTFIVMAVLGFNLETITLLALALVTGIIIDDAIVDVENIARHIEDGESPRQAALTATGEIGLTVAAATFTLVAVFLPVGVMGGTVGQFFKPFGLTISASVLISLLISRTLTPVLSARWLRPNPVRPSGAIDTFGKTLVEGYRDLLRWALTHRGWVMGLALVSFVGGLALIPLIPQGFIPKLDRGEFNVTYSVSRDRLQREIQPLLQASLEASQRKAIEALIATGAATDDAIAAASRPDPAQLKAQTSALMLAQSNAIATQLETAIRQNPNVESVFAILGDRGALTQGRLNVRLKDDRPEHTAQIQDQIRRQLPLSAPILADVSLSVEDIQFVDSGSSKPLQIALEGNDLDRLFDTAQLLKKTIQASGQFVDLSATGDDQAIVSASAKPASPDPASPDPASPDPVKPVKPAIQEIQHHHGKRVAYISANLRQGQALGPATDLAVSLAKPLLPSGISLDLGGDSGRSTKVLGSFLPTLGLSIVTMFAVLLLLFRRWLDPLVIVLSLPLSIVGAMLGLLVTQSEFGMIALLGMLLLLGLANKNAILIIDGTNQLRQQGMDRTQALLRTGPRRLRPVMMTTVSAIAGMVPIALGLGAGAELRQPLAVSIIGGLMTSTLLSLIVVPVLYSILDDVQGAIGRVVKRG
jgi:multidrug efflux pump subunit AcrB